MERLEELTLLSFSPLNYTLSLNAITKAQATGGPQYSFQFPINAPFNNTLPGSLTYSTDESAESTANGNHAEANAQASMTATASTESDSSQSGKIVLQDSFQNQLNNNGFVYSEGDTNWSYTFNSDSAFAFNLSYSFSWFYDSASSPVNHPGYLGGLNVTNLDNNTQVFHQDFDVPNGTTLTRSPSPTLLPPGNYAIFLYISDIGYMNFVNSSGSQTAILPGSITWGLNNITLVNPAPLVQQTIPAKITNTSGTDLSYQLSVDPPSAATLSATSVDLAAGASTDVTITPTADGAAPNDVHIIAMAGKLKADEDDMTIVSVTIPQDIRNTDTPDGMADRIPPRVPTEIDDVTVTPDLAGSGQSVTLAVEGQNFFNGSVTIDGNSTPLTITSSPSDNKIYLSSPDGSTQTRGGFWMGNFGVGVGLFAGNLKLTVQVRDQDTTQSKGFSVAAIPENLLTANRQLIAKG